MLASQQILTLRSRKETSWTPWGCSEHQQQLFSPFMFLFMCIMTHQKNTRLRDTPDRNEISIFFPSSSESNVQDFLHHSVHCSFTKYTLGKVVVMNMFCLSGYLSWVHWQWDHLPSWTCDWAPVAQVLAAIPRWSRGLRYLHKPRLHSAMLRDIKHLPLHTRGSLARLRRKQATATKLRTYSTYSPWSSIHFLACCS